MARSALEAWVEARLSALGAHAHQWQSQPFTIFRVPAYVRESNRTAYEPRMVSVGPYYHGSPGLRAMEDHKWRYLHDLLVRNPALTSTTLVEEMRSMEARARLCYSESTAALGSDEFIQMLLLDGCFVLEFFFKWHTKEPDALCDVGWGLTLVSTDLLLLENQIPFFVLERIYEFVAAGAQQGGSRENLFKLLLEYIRDDEQDPPPIALPATCEIDHLLHLYYESFVPDRSPPHTLITFSSGNKKKKKTTTTTTARVIPCAMEMSEAGVTFSLRSEARDVYDVAFDGRRGLMEIPKITVDDMRRPLLVNLIAFEQAKRGAEEPRVVTSYVSLMSTLIRTPRDVELLRRRGVLDNLLADDDEAARFFSHLADGVAINYDAQVFAGLYDDVRSYCSSWRHRNRAALMRDYFGSPWSAIAFVVAGLVVALTATQTYFTVFPR